MPDKDGQADVSDIFKSAQKAKMDKLIAAQAEAENNFQKVINHVVKEEAQKKAQIESEQMPRLSIMGPHGYHVEFDPQHGPNNTAKAKENDTYVCQHCGQLKVFYPDTIKVVCKRCAGDVGECCAHKGICHPVTNPNRWERMEQMEDQAERERLKRLLGG